MANSDRVATIWKIVFVGYWLALFVATHLPRAIPVVPRNPTDKSVHLVAFAVLSWLMAMAWERSTGHLRRGHLIAVFAVLAVYAAIDELTQIPVGRTGSVNDWLADVVGAAIGLVLFAVFRRE